MDLLTRKLRQNHLNRREKYKWNPIESLSFHQIGTRSNWLSTKQRWYLVELVPEWIEVLFDGVAAEGDACHTDLDVGVTLPLHHSPHEVVLGYQVLGLDQMNTQNSLWVPMRTVSVTTVHVWQMCEWCLPLSDSGQLFFTSVANSGSGVVCCGRVGAGLASPPGPMGFSSAGNPPWPIPDPEDEGRGDGVVGVASSLSHKTWQQASRRLWGSDVKQ